VRAPRDVHLVLLALGEDGIVGLEAVGLEKLLSSGSRDRHVEEGVAHGDEEGSRRPVGDQREVSRASSELHRPLLTC
jgi:hypothetical protein